MILAAEEYSALQAELWVVVAFKAEIALTVSGSISSSLIMASNLPPTAPCTVSDFGTHILRIVALNGSTAIL
jgi:hypothetical protein